jgi:hypothetical protein
MMEKGSGDSASIYVGLFLLYKVHIIDGYIDMFVTNVVNIGNCLVSITCLNNCCNSDFTLLVMLDDKSFFIANRNFVSWP